MQVKNKKIDFKVGKFHKNSKFWLFLKFGKNLITVVNYNEYTILTLNTQILQLWLWHVKEKYLFNEIKQTLFDWYIVDNCCE